MAKQVSLDEITASDNEGRYNSITHVPSILTARTKGLNERDCTVTKETLSVRSMEYCSRFESCSAPKCPLDILINLRTVVEDDPECEMAKATRHKYWESMPEDLRSALPFKGYFESEYRRMKIAREKWESLPDDQKAAVRERMRNIRRGNEPYRMNFQREAGNVKR